MQFVCLQKKYEQLQQEHKELKASRDEQEQMAQEFRQRATKLAQSLEESQRLNKEKIEKEQVWSVCVGPSTTSHLRCLF